MARPNQPRRPNSHRLNAPETPVPNQPTKPKKKHHFFIWLLVLILVGAGGYGAWKLNNSYDEADSPSSLMAINRESKNSNQFVMEYYWQPGCKDCKKVDKAGIEKSLKKATLHNRVVKINTKKFKEIDKRNKTNIASQWFASNYVTETPTLIVKYQGKPVYLYSGTNIKKFNQLLDGKNPETGKALPHKTPTHEVYLNDFDHSRQNFVSVNPTE